MPAKVATMTNPNRSEVIVSFAFNAHDSSIAIAIEDKVELVVEAERPSREKRRLCTSVKEMEDLISLALSQLHLTPAAVTHWCGTAFLNKFFPPSEQTCEWADSREIVIFGERSPFCAINHHLAHASMYYASPFDHAVIKSCDGGGDGQKHVMFLGAGNEISLLPGNEPTRMFNGTFYDVASSYIYGRDGNDGKFMGLSAYGELDGAMYKFFEDRCDALCNHGYDDPYGLPTRGWTVLDALGLSDSNISSPSARAFARTAQRFFEDQQVLATKSYQHLSDNLVYVGGSALNVLANEQIRKQTSFKEIYIPPCCDDTGQSLGALLYYMVNHLKMEPSVRPPFLGLGHDHGNRAPIEEQCLEQVVTDLKEGRVVAWHYGQGEIGPRALGHRSLLASPLRMESKVLVSETVKKREWYRPVAPMVLFEHQADYFESTFFSPYMQFSSGTTDIAKSRVPAVVHVDGSARLQSIVHDFDAALHAILSAWHAHSGVPVLINTSLNGPGMPICSSYTDTLEFAKDCPSVSVYLDGKRAE